MTTRSRSEVFWRFSRQVFVSVLLVFPTSIRRQADSVGDRSLRRSLTWRAHIAEDRARAFLHGWHDGVPQIGRIVRRWFVFESRGSRDERAAKICPRNCVPAIWKMLAALKCRLCWRARSKHYSRSPKRKGPPERPMVPKAQRLFVSNCLALRRQLTARRLADCCRVDARFTLAFWTLASGR